MKNTAVKMFMIRNLSVKFSIKAVFSCFLFYNMDVSVCRMGRGENMGHLPQPKQKNEPKPLDVDPLFIRFLRTFKEILKFILFSYTVLFGALLLARWTTYFMVGK